MLAAATEAHVLTVSPFPRVLLVDQEADVRTTIKDGLSNFGFDVRTVSDARAAASILSDWMPEAILIGAAPHGVDAFSLVASLRRITDVPILMIGGRCDTSDKVAALTRGADDCLEKPCIFEELAAYIHARLRRPRIEFREIVRFADLSIDVTQRKVSRAARAIDMSTREFDLLLTLARHPQRVFTRAQLLDLVWGIERDITTATVETYISYIRSKVDVKGIPCLIHTLRGVGYTMRLSD